MKFLVVRTTKGRGEEGLVLDHDFLLKNFDILFSPLFHPEAFKTYKNTIEIYRDLDL